MLEVNNSSNAVEKSSASELESQHLPLLYYGPRYGSIAVASGLQQQLIPLPTAVDSSRDRGPWRRVQHKTGSRMCSVLAQMRMIPGLRERYFSTSDISAPGADPGVPTRRALLHGAFCFSGVHRGVHTSRVFFGRTVLLFWIETGHFQKKKETNLL